MVSTHAGPIELAGSRRRQRSWNVLDPRSVCVLLEECLCHLIYGRSKSIREDHLLVAGRSEILEGLVIQRRHRSLNVIL